MEIAIQRSQLPIELEVQGTGDEALKKLKDSDSQTAPDVIILDINLPGMNGFEILEDIQQDPRIKKIPLYMLSSSENSKDRARALEGGAMEYFSKPIEIRKLQELVKFFYDSSLKREPQI
jgi:CheY-like chemotaxis protein